MLSAEYTTDAVLDRIGSSGQDGLGRNSTIPAEVSLAGEFDPQATMIRLWLLQQRVPLVSVGAALPITDLVAKGYLIVEDDQVRAGIDIRPYGSPDDQASGWVVSDLQPGLDGFVTPTRADYVLGVSPASTTLAQITARNQIGSALDLGTGCGVQALHLGRHARKVVATDVNPRALELAALTCALSGVEVDLRSGSLYEPTPETFDLIVSNPPFVMSPPSGERLVYRESSFVADSLVESLVKESANHLNPGGSLQMLTNWAITDQDWAERIDAWIPAGFDAWVIERERLDVHSYIEMWLTDAGLLGRPGWRSGYLEWLDYFAGLGVKEVGMGWLQVTRAQRSTPDRVFESWPHMVAQPVGEVFARRMSRVTRSLLPEAELLEAKLVLATDVTQETIGDPGAEDPEFIVYRSHTGLCRAEKLDTASAGVLGACDGELSLGTIISAVGQLLDMDVAASVVPVVRRMLAEGLLS